LKPDPAAFSDSECAYEIKLGNFQPGSTCFLAGTVGLGNGGPITDTGSLLFPATALLVATPPGSIPAGKSTIPIQFQLDEAGTILVNGKQTGEVVIFIGQGNLIDGTSMAGTWNCSPNQSAGAIGAAPPCGSGYGGTFFATKGSFNAGAVTSVSVSCAPTSILATQTSACTATVQGTGNFISAVSWSVTPASVGTVSPAGVFTPNGPGTAIISATSMQDPTKSGNATVTVIAPPPITSVSVNCNPASIMIIQTSTCTATVTGTPLYGWSVSWQATNGTIASSGNGLAIFTPTGVGTAAITATLTQDNTKSGTASIVVGNAVAAGEWTWMDGNPSISYPNRSGSCGAIGQASVNFIPGSRVGSASWTDLSGNLWLFGGGGMDCIGGSGALNDLWEYNPTSGTWTWVSGSNTVDASGSYGARGVASALNVPGARIPAASWTDRSGNLWLFGGTVSDSTNLTRELNDLWEFNPTNKEWTWVSGTYGSYAVGVYGVRGVASADNTPGARASAVSWTDKNGNFWLFGGVGGNGLFNDLWKFDPTAKTWTWVSGSNNVGAAGTYGTKGVASTFNVPGSRFGSSGWMDSKGNLWLYGGGCTAVGPPCPDDLWEFNPATTEWTWVAGSNSTTNGQSAVYGTLGTPSALSTPGSRSAAISWIDGSDNLYLFGASRVTYSADGYAYSDTNDLWKFDPKTTQWVWLGGSGINGPSDTPGYHGTLGVASPANIPTGRDGVVGWTGKDGTFWLFGGEALGGTTTPFFNDLWRYQP
jgi:N-acetylneuraminic acid mutarotase